MAPAARRLVVWVGALARLLQRSILVQARARLEAVTVGAIDLNSIDAFQIALGNRLDFMNARASLVDSWRQIQFTADALQSSLNVTGNGQLRTARNNPVSFRAPTGNVRLGLEFDAPFTRLLERNDYRESLISYQRNRRSFIQSRDSLHLGIRELLREVDLLSENLEIQRRSVAIAIRRVDLTRADLYAPVAPPQPGQRVAQFNNTTAFQLLSAQSALRTTQNNFLGVWLAYYASRMRLARELGIMVLDIDGSWIEYPLPGSGDSEVGCEPMLNSPAPGGELPPPVGELPPLLPAEMEAPAGGAEAPPVNPEAPPLPPEIPAAWLEIAATVPYNLVPTVFPPATLPSEPPLQPSSDPPSPIHRLPPVAEPPDTNRYTLAPAFN
jgi:hypothetical protein